MNDDVVEGMSLPDGVLRPVRLHRGRRTGGEDMTNIPKGKVNDLLHRRLIDLKRDVCLMAEVGSTVHGINIGDQDDLDLTVVRFEGWHEFVNGPPKRQSMMVRTKPEGERSGPGDIDINVYTLRKFAGLAAGGNPSILTVLHSPSPWRGRFEWLDWGDLADYVRSKRAGQAFLGYMRQQLERWSGKRGQKNVNRPELVDAYGFDTKYAGHAIRLGIQGAQYMEHGVFQVPMHPGDAKLVREVRKGAYTEAQAMNIALMVERRLKQAVEDSLLPDRANNDGVALWLDQAYSRVLR